ncbi:MAG: YafY family protein [Lachnospiraceae bacterium]|nr:YafY family protein [Lachnospiraceae bacterium]
MKIDRLIGILSILLQKKKVTAPWLAERFEVSRRTIHRDIEDLCRAGIPIVTSQGANGGISIMEGYSIHRTLLTSSDMQAILAGLRSLDSVSGTNRYGQLMEKLSAGSSKLVTGDETMLIDLSSWDKNALAPKIELFRAAIEQRELVAFDYYAPGGETRRRIEPYYLVFHWSTWYVWGWCACREDFRMFKLNRMAWPQRTGERFEERPVPMPELSPERIFPATLQVKARFSAEYKWRLIEEFGADSFQEEPEGSLLFQAGFADRGHLFGWILTFGSRAELLEPVELREELAQIGRELQEKYHPQGI